MAIGLINDGRIGSDTDSGAETTNRRKHFESFLDTELNHLHLNALSTNMLGGPELCEAIYECISPTKNVPNDCDRTKTVCHQTVINSEADGWNQLVKICVVAIICLLISSPISYLADYMLGIRCILPNNYLIWEATRPISDCSYCRGVNRPLILNNMTQDEFQVRFHSQWPRSFVRSLHSLIRSFHLWLFQPFAYSPRPIIIKNAVSHWPAKQTLSFEYLRQLYLENPLALDAFDEECQFLQFQSNFASLRQLFDSVNDIVGKSNGSASQPSWYVGFSNCQTSILNALRELYPRPHFLPADAEIPNTDYIFLGYDQGAVMHVSAEIYVNLLQSKCVRR